MQTMLTVRLAAVGLALCALGYAPGAAAQPQCKVQYAWTANDRNQSATTDIPLGDTKTINRSNMRYVRNSGDWPIEVTMDGVLVAVFTLQPGDRNPASGSYQTLPFKSPPELLKLRCVTPSFSTASQLIQAYQATGQSVNVIARGLKDLMGLGGAQVFSALRSANIAVNQATAAVRQAFNAGGEEVAAWLVQTGVPFDEIGGALRATFQASAQQVAQWLNAAGVNRTNIARALAGVPQFTPQQVIGALRSVTSATAEQVVAVLKQLNKIITAQLCSPNDCSQPAEWLKVSGYTAEQALAALRVHFNVTRERAEQLAQTVFGLVGEAIQQALAAAGYGIQMTQMLVAQGQVTLGQAQASTIDISLVVHGDYRTCGLHPSAYQGGRIFAGAEPVRLQNSGQPFPLTLVGSVGLAAPGVSVQGFPPGTQVSVTSRVPCTKGNSFLVLQVRVPTGVPSNSSGTGRVEVGGQTGATFPWVVAPIASLGPAQGAVAAGGPARAAAPPAVNLQRGQPDSPRTGAQCVGTGGLQPQVTLAWREDPAARQLPDGSHEVLYEVQMRNAGMGGFCPDNNPQSLADPASCSYSLQNSLTETFIAAFEAAMEWRVRPVLRETSAPWPGRRSVQEGPWSAWQAFTVVPNMTQPPLQSAPSDGHRVNLMRGSSAQTQRVEWEDIACAGASYDVEVGRRQSSNEAPTLSQTFTRVSNRFVDIRVEQGYEYLWRVRRSGSNTWSVYRLIVTN